MQVICANHSSTPVERVFFSLRRVTEYYSTKPPGFNCSESYRVMKKEAGGVDKKSEQTYEHVLEIPADLEATTCEPNIIRFRYELKVEAKISGLYKNLVQFIPLTLGTVPFLEDLGESVPIGAVSTLPGASHPAPGPIHSPPSIPMPMPYSGDSSVTPVAPIYPTLMRPPQYNQISNFQSPLNRNSFTNSSVRSDSSGISPSAPPLEFSSPHSTRSSIYSQQIGDTPPSYDQVFGGGAQAAPMPPRNIVQKRMAPQPS